MSPVKWEPTFVTLVSNEKKKRFGDILENWANYCLIRSYHGHAFAFEIMRL